MNRHRVKPQVSIVGSSSLLVIFAVLCLTVFALLGLSTVLADSRLLTNSSKMVMAYYSADTQAEEILAQLRQGIIPDNVQEQNDHSYQYICPISEQQALYVHVVVYDSTWDVLQWRVITAEQAETDELLSLWDGSM